MVAELGTQYFMSGMFWFANFLALLSSIAYGFRTTGPTKGKLMWQINVVKPKTRLRVIGMFFVYVLSMVVG